MTSAVTPDPSSESRFGAEALHRLEAGFCESKIPMYLVDDRRRFVTANETACAILGTTPQQLVWRTIDEFASAEQLAQMREQWAELMARGSVEGTYDVQVPDGEPVTVEASATANVVPSRHLVVFLPVDENSVTGGNHLSDADTWMAGAAPPENRVQLTEREREVMTLVARGMRSGEIAERLFLAPETVKSHVSNAMHKLGSHTRAGAVAIALVTGQIAWESN